MKKILLTLTLLCFSSINYAKDIDQAYKVYGAGSFTCKQYLHARHQDPVAEIKFRHWLAGYITAFNLIVVNTYNIMGTYDFNKALKWLDRRCRSDKKAIIANAVAEMTTILYPDRVNINPQADNKAKWAK